MKRISGIIAIGVIVCVILLQSAAKMHLAEKNKKEEKLYQWVEPFEAAEYRVLIAAFCEGIGFGNAREYFGTAQGTPDENGELPPAQRFVGTLETAQAACLAAEALWLEIYGEPDEQGRPYIVKYDADEGIWMVGGAQYGEDKEDIGWAYVLLRASDGKVLRLWLG